MIKIDGKQFENKDHKAIMTRFIKFYKKNNECSERCPMNKSGSNGTPRAVQALEERYDITGFGFRLKPDCWCHIFKEFKGFNNCPCRVFPNKAFLLLEKVVMKHGQKYL
jgi:hypothetical protein